MRQRIPVRNLSIDRPTMDQNQSRTSTRRELHPNGGGAALSGFRGKRSGVSKTLSADVETFFAGRAIARRVYAAVERAVADAGASTVRVTKSQVAFSRRRGFAWAWTPDRWLHGKTAPLVVSIALSRRDGSPRWKEVVEPRPGRFMHHLELGSTREVDNEVRSWLAEAWAQAA